jgi:galactosyl transferase GMA12/MNN10 family
VPVRNLIQALWAPFIHPITEPTFTDRHNGLVHNYSGQPIWTESLGKKICIVDVDTRPLNDTNEVFNPEFSWDKIDGVSPGILNHYLYAMIHGYDYKHIHTTNYPDRSAYWTKIPAMSDTLRDYRFVVTLDADAIFRDLELPYEWLLNRWNVTPETSFAMPLDPSWDQNKNKFGRLNTNAGFITVQNLPRTHEILRAWEACPEKPGCEHFKDGWPAEQGAFGEFTRYEFNRSTDIREFACTDGNGFPEMGTECEGLFVTHYTIDKSLLKKGIADSLARSVMGMMHADIQQHKQTAIIERTSNAFLD